MKRYITIVVLLSLLLFVTGCNKKAAVDETGLDRGVSSTKAGTEDSEVSSNEVEDNKDLIENTEEVDLIALSEELALQMVEGDFTKTHDIMSLFMKAQIREAALKQSWEQTVALLGDFIKIYEVTEETTDKFKTVFVILQYENDGLQVSFTYNSSDKLDGLWIKPSPITATESNEIYEETEITIGEDQYAVAGILTMPVGVTKPPVVILVHGSGTHGMDETIGPNKPFRDIAHGLADKGIATVRYQERLLQYPDMVDATKITIQDDSLDDAANAIRYALSCDKVDEEHIYIIGHSLGGMMAPKIAADHKEIAGIVSLAGSLRRLEDIIFDQNSNYVATLKQFTDEQKEEILADTKKQVDYIKGLKESDKDAVFGAPVTYWYSMNQFDIPELAASLEIPILILQGSADFQVFADKDYVAWQELLSDKDNVTFKLYDNLNHLFMITNGKTDVTEYDTEGIVDQQVIEDIALWINDMIKYEPVVR